MNIKTILTISCIITLHSIVFAQHDPGRNAVRLIAKGNHETALKILHNPTRRMNSPIDEAEKLFVEAMSVSIQNKPNRALKLAKQAVEKGLPIERLQAGPRKAFKSLYQSKEYQSWIAQKQKSLLHGPLLGSVTGSSAKFWFRTASETEIEVRVLNKTNQNIVSKGKVSSNKNKDFTAVVLVEGLNPNTNYVYDVYIKNKKIKENIPFKTHPKSHSASQFKVIFGGGAGYTPQYERMWSTILDRNPNALLLLGDNIYIDDPTHPTSNYFCYYRRQSNEKWKALTASTSVYTIYDDHDFGMNDCIPGPKIEEPSWKRQVWNIFKQNWNNPNNGGNDKNPGCWYSYYIGEVQFIMLDCRYYRNLKGGSMIGPHQKKWLFDQLKNSKAKFKVLCSSVPWSPGVKPRSKDTWDGFPQEREEIFSYIEKQNIDGVLLVSADRHRTDMRKIKRENGYDFYECMSSRLTNVHTHPLMQNAKGSEFIMGYNKECSFGMLEFDTLAKDPTIKFSIVNINNKDIDTRELKLNELKK